MQNKLKELMLLAEVIGTMHNMIARRTRLNICYFKTEGKLMWTEGLRCRL